MEAEVEEIPEEGELVLATVREITSHGVYVSLDEYGGFQGFLHISEISTGWVRNIERYVRPAQKMVLKVIHVSRSRREVDLSLRQVTGEEKKAKLMEVKKAEKARSIYEIIKNRLSLPDEEAAEYRDALIEGYGSLYEAFEQVARGRLKILEKMDLPTEFVETLKQIVKEKIVIPTVRVKGVVEATTNDPKGIELIRKAMSTAGSVRTGGSRIDIRYLGAPRYRIVVEAEDYKTAERALANAVQKIQAILKESDVDFIRDDGRR